MMGLVDYTKGFGPYPEDTVDLVKHGCFFHMKDEKTEATEVK